MNSRMVDSYDKETWEQIRAELQRAFSHPGIAVILPNTTMEVSKPKPVIQFVAAEAGDWMACYLNGIEVDQGHSLYVVHLLKTLSDLLGFEVPDTIYYTDEQMDAMGNHFPDRLEGIDEQV